MLVVQDLAVELQGVTTESDMILPPVAFGLFFFLIIHIGLFENLLY